VPGICVSLKLRVTGCETGAATLASARSQSVRLSERRTVERNRSEQGASRSA
jgi:hypothetical protein